MLASSLLTAAARHLADSGFDLKSLKRAILQSETYQRSAQPLPDNQADTRFYSRYYPRRLMAEVLLDAGSERRWLRLVRARLGHLFPYVPQQPGYNKRLRALATTICWVLRELAAASPSICDRVRLLDSTPVPCAASRETVKRSELAGYAAYGYCASHSRFFWGFRLYVLTTPDGLPVDFALAPANAGEREVAAAMFDRRPLIPGQVLVTDKGFASGEFEEHVAAMGATLVHPDRKNEQPRFGSLGDMRQ